MGMTTTITTNGNKTMRVTVYRATDDNNVSAKTYGLMRDDLADFIAICGWMVVNDIQNMTAEDRAEINRIGESGDLTIRPDARRWLRERELAAA